ncbi:uncharacterized protein LOC141811258 isoform X2 [Halichoeres trimaculatus]|uniref:uncharacterized protein LOC141811258 isoform X2 n=1 Tax=Halichoeres trimaculatus TaxID=147232 RepID=UPI003D9E0489
MPLAVRSSVRRRRKNPDEKLPERPGESSDQVMAPTRMKLRVRRRENVTEGAAGGDSQQQEEEEERSRGSNRRKNNNNNTSSAATSSSSSPPSSSASARAVIAAEETSPDSKCPICLDRFNNLAYLDRCLHRFCFPCIQEWSHNKAECPLCKQPFASILHSVRAEDDFKEYTLRPAPANSSVAATVAMVAAMASAARSDHQMRLMLRRHREEEGETTTRRRRRDRVGRGGANRRARVWQWYLDSPPLALPPLPHPSSVAAEDSEEGEELEDQRRGGADLSERGVIFEGLTGLGGTVAPLAPTDRASRRLMTRLAARQRLQREGGTVRRLRERETVAFRRALYRCGVRVRSIAGNGNQGQQQRDITAESFRRNPVHLNRLRPWLRRELTVLYGAHGSLVDIVQRIIMARLARHGLEDTPTIEDELRPFLLARTDHFLHELVSFARSPLSLENYDLQAVYEPPDATLEVDGTSSSSDSSSVIAISEGEEEGGGTEEIPLRREGGAHDDVIQTGSCLSLSAWDDETPGPSYSTAEPSCSLSSLSFSPAPQEATNEEGGGKREEEEEVEECLIVGYKKPIAERTPELVQLSSDTEEEAEEKKEEKKKEETAEKLPDLPSLPPPISFSPTIPPSTSGTCREEGAQKEKDKEVGRCRSWSGSSGRSRNSVCMLSPETPRERERRRERERKRAGSEKRRRRKRSRRGSERKSGTLYNPNRSIYPAIMRPCIHSSSPLHSSADSASPLPPSPPDSTVSYHCSQASPLTSSISSPCSSSPSSSSPLFSSPQLSSQTPPTPSLSPSYHSNSHHREKPGGKRKYKSRHLDSDDKDPTWRPSSSQRGEGARRRERREKERRRREREGGRRRERSSRRDSGSRRRREDRSPSVEIIYEGTIDSNAALPPARKRHRKRHRRTQLSSSPVIITLDSDSSRDNIDINNDSDSSSPLSSQQTVDFCDLPPLPLMPSTGMGGALNSEIGELPADILDQGSDGSETEPGGRAAGTIAVVNSDNSDGEVDVENVEESGLMTRSAEERGLKRRREERVETTRETRTARDDDSTSTGPNHGAPRTQTEDMPLDSRLLATILNDLKGIAAPSLESGTSLDIGQSHSWDLPNKEDRLAEKRQPNFPEEKLSKETRDQNHSSSSSSLPLREQQVQHESRDVPPLLKKASPVRTHNRNTPPPLKHKDAGSPHLLPIPSVDLQTSGELPGDNQVIPPISTLKRHFNNILRGSTPHLASTSNSSTTDYHSPAPSEVGALAVHSKRDKPYIDSPSGSQIRAHFSPHADFNSFYPSTSREVPVGQRAPSTDFHYLHSLPPIDFQSKASWSKEKPALSNSTSRGCQVAPAILHPSSRDSGEGTPAGGDVFSGTKCNETSRPVFVSETDSRTQNPVSPVDSRSQKFPTSGESAMSTTGATEACSFSETVEVPMDSVSSSYKRRSPINLNFATPDKHTNTIFSPSVDQYLNHTPFTSTTFQTQQRKQGSLPKSNTDTHSNPHHPDPKAFNHIDQTSNPQLCLQSWSEQNPTIDSHPKLRSNTDSHPPSWPTIDPHPQPCQSIVDPHPQSKPTIDSHSKTPVLDFHNSTDNHISRQSVENYHNSHSPIDSHSNSESPVDEHSSSSFWKTHTRLK